MRGLKAFGVGLILVGIYLTILSFFLPAPAAVSITPSASGGGGSSSTSSGFTGCVILFFIPVCFSGGSAPQWLPIAFIGVFIAFVAIFFITVVTMFRRARPRPYV